MNEEIDLLLSRYFGGEATEEELRRLDAWLAQSIENEAYFDKMTFLYQKVALTEEMNPPDMEAALSRFRSYMQKDEKIIPKNHKFRFSRTYRIAAASIGLLLVGISLYFLLRNPAEKIRYISTVDVPQQYILFDHVGLTLAPGSQISYKSGKKDEVYLTGKATFTVDTGYDKELLIRAGDTYIKDIGTIFTVTAYYPETLIAVEVMEGEILFYTQTDAGISVKRDEKGEYNPRTRQFNHIIPVNRKNNSGDIVFHATPLSEAIHILENRYGATIIIEPDLLGEMQISASFDNNESVENILAIIAATLSVNISKEGDVFVISQ